MKLIVWAAVICGTLLEIPHARAEDVDLTFGVAGEPADTRYAEYAEKELKENYIPIANQILKENACDLSLTFKEIVVSKFQEPDTDEELANGDKYPGMFKLTGNPAVWNLSSCKGRRTFEVDKVSRNALTFECTVGESVFMTAPSLERRMVPVLLIRGIAHLAGMKDAEIPSDDQGRVANPLPLVELGQPKPKALLLDWPELQYVKREKIKENEPDWVELPYPIKITKNQCSMMVKWAEAR
ncbi:hypothetical protein HFO33_32660 [Rhizobium leguminosarum]|uniref:hypothetical protein n=1 Tax=Rhizobium leguminosarum TaxID=384 RepID=UPI001C984D62|nr:hypothetical protein [Rhizobium leguminosarum]MBY5721253.1 hypothetical protein [Rhizobium leguminosarum]